MTDTCTNYEQDEDYYMETTTFLVENRLFKVPRHYFSRFSSIFGALFSLPQKNNTAEGCSDELPITLHGISKQDFRGLLKAMYPIEPMYGDLTTDDWISALKLATMWDFTEIRQRAISQLSSAKMSAVDRVVLARECNVPSWLIMGCNELLRRTATLTLEEAKLLGIEIAVALYQTREEIAATDYHYGYGCRRREAQDFSALVKRVFADQLKDMESLHGSFSVQ